MGPYWGPRGVLGSLLGPFFATLGRSGHPLGAVQEPFGTSFLNLSAQEPSQEGFYTIFNDFLVGTAECVERLNKSKF